MKRLLIGCAVLWLVGGTVLIAAYEGTMSHAAKNQDRLEKDSKADKLKVFHPALVDSVLMDYALKRYAAKIIQVATPVQPNAMPKPEAEPSAKPEPEPKQKHKRRHEPQQQSGLEEKRKQRHPQHGDICQRTGGEKVETQNGKSWHCEYPKRKS